MTRDRKKLFHILTTWGGIILFITVILYFILELWPKWQPEFIRFRETSREGASPPMIVIAFVLLMLGYYFTPAPRRKILDSFKIPKIDKGGVRRNWYITQLRH